MCLDRFLTLLAVIIAFLGSIFLLKGILALSPDLMAKQVQTYLGYSLPQIQAQAGQKADAICGVAFVAIAFLLQIINLALVDEGITSFDSKMMGVITAIALSAVLSLTLLSINYGIRERQKIGIGKVIAGQKLDSVFASTTVTIADVKELKNLAKVLLNIDLSNVDDPEAVLKGVAEKTKRVLPTGLDFSQARPDGK